MRARSLSGQGWPVSEPPERTRAVGGFFADRDLGGALLFGYFLLGKQEKVTRSPGMASEKAQGRGAGFAKRTKSGELRSWIPAFAGMTKLGLVGMTR